MWKKLASEGKKASIKYACLVGNVQLCRELGLPFTQGFLSFSLPSNPYLCSLALHGGLSEQETES